MTTDELLEEGKRLIERMRNIGKNIETQNEKLDEAKRKMDIIDHGWKWKKIDQPEWFDNEELMSVFSDEWKERMKQGKFTLSEEEAEIPDWLNGWKIKMDYWDNLKYTGDTDCSNMTLKEMSKLFDEKIKEWNFELIKKAEKEDKIYDIDRLFWDGGKLFGYDTRQSRIGPWSFAKVEKDGCDYTIKFKFDWERCELILACDDFNATIAEPIRAQARIGFDMLFGVNPSVVKIMIKTEVERLIKEIERLKNDGKNGRL